MRTSMPLLHPQPLLLYMLEQLLKLAHANPSNVHEHMMLPKLDTFVLLMMKDLAWTRRMAIGAGTSMEKKVRARERTMELSMVIFAL